MKLFSVLAAGAGLIPFFTLSPALGQQPGGAEGQAPPGGGQLISLEFSGGTVAEYVDAVLKVAKDINIVVMPEARDFDVPPLTLTGVAVGSAMELLHGRTEFRGRKVVELRVHEIEPFQGQGRAIFTVSSSASPPESGPSDEAGVWTISELLAGDTKAEDVLTAVQTAVDLIADRYGPAEIRYHEATGLVIARGHDRQISTVEQVIQRLREGKGRAQGRGRSATSDAADADSRVVSLMAALDQAKSHNRELQQRLADTEKQIQQLLQERSEPAGGKPGDGRTRDAGSAPR